MSMIKVGLLGYGLAGRVYHMPFIEDCADMTLSAVGSRSFDANSALHGVRTGSVDEVINDPEIDLIVVATPNTSHYPFARQALSAGKHVVVDKPFVIRSSEADALIKLAAEKQRLLSVYQNRRWDSSFRTAQQAISTGKLGDLSYAELHFDRFNPAVKDKWRDAPIPGGGLLYDLGSHLIDQAYCLFGMPKAVTANVTAQRPGSRVDDFFHIILDYGTLRVVLHATSLAHNHAPRIALYGNKACFQFFGLDAQEDDLRSGKTPKSPRWGHTDDAKALMLSTDGGCTDLDPLPGSYEAYYQGIAKAIRGDSPLPVLAEEARDTLAILEASIRSGVERRSVALI